MAELKFTPQGPFSLAMSNRYFGGWLPVEADENTVAMAFPVEGWRTSAAVILRQTGGAITGEVHGAHVDAEKAWHQALATLSLDVDATGWPEVGRRDPVIGRLQAAYPGLRPVLFHSPYEAAAAFIIGHRISIKQGRAIRQTMAKELGDGLQVGETQLYAFPRPQVLRELSSFKGISAEKIERLHGLAESALAGDLDRAQLLSTPIEIALARLRTLKGVGPFFSQGILHRGAGIVDDVTDDDVSKQAIQRAYGLEQRPTQKEVLARAEAWRPFRMWTTVHLHVWFRREAGDPQREPKKNAQGSAQTR